MRTDRDEDGHADQGQIRASLSHQCWGFPVSLLSFAFGLALLASPLEANAQGSLPPPLFTFTTNNGVLSVVRYNGRGGIVNIPSTSDGLPVTTIEDSAFVSRYSLEPLTITIPGSITNIGSSAFVSRFPFHSQLQTIEVDPSNPSYSSVDGVLFDKNQDTIIRYPPAKGTYYAIPVSVTHIASNSFQGCLGLRGVYFQGDAPSVDATAFAGANNVTVYYLTGTAGWGTTFGGRPAVLYNPLVPFTYVTNLGAITITGYIGMGGAVTIPEDIDGMPVTSIGESAFAGGDLTSVTIGNNVTNIGNFAFAGSKITDATIGNNVTGIGDFAFSSCYSLTNVLIGDSVIRIGESAFNNCAFVSITIPDSVTRIGPRPFYNCHYLQTIMIGTGLTTLEDWGFEYCPNLTAITVNALNPVYGSADGVLISRAQSTVLKCPEGKSGSFTIPNDVISIGQSAFRFCVSLTNVIIGNSVSNIGSEAFSACTGLVNVAIPNSVITIGDSAFGGCDSLSSVTIGASVASIGSSAFGYCTSLASVVIPNSVTSLGSDAFSGCTSLTNVSIGNNISIIAHGTFGGCGSLASVTIPNSVLTIEDWAFAGCMGLADLTIGTNVTHIGELAFKDCTSLTSVTLPESVSVIGEAAFAECPNLTELYFRGNAPSSGQGAFSNSDKVTVFYLPSATGWGPAFGDRPTALWLPRMNTTDDRFGIRSNRFGFEVTWANGQVVAVDACTNLGNPAWFPLQTNTLSGDSFYFSDSQWTNHPARFYRLRSL